VKKSFKIQELLHLNGTKPMHPSSSGAFQRHHEHDLEHPGLVDLITTKQNKLPSFIYIYIYITLVVCWCCFVLCVYQCLFVFVVTTSFMSILGLDWSLFCYYFVKTIGVCFVTIFVCMSSYFWRGLTWKQINQILQNQPTREGIQRVMTRTHPYI
jgi:hypothetical protein